MPAVTASTAATQTAVHTGVTHIEDRAGGSERAAVDRLELARAALGTIAETNERALQSALQRLFAPQFRVLGPGRDLCAAHALAFRPGDFHSFEERALTVTDLVAEGDRVVGHIEFSGKQRGLFCGQSGHGQPRSASGVVVLQFDGARIEEAWLVLRWD